MFALCIKLLRNEFISLPENVCMKKDESKCERMERERGEAKRKMSGAKGLSYMATHTQSFLMNATSLNILFILFAAHRTESTTKQYKKIT